jgi:hypothetical protein
MEAPRLWIRKEMGLSHEELFRLLPALAAGASPEVSGKHIRLPLDGGRVDLSLEEEGERRLGPTVRLPVTWVELAFFGCDEAETKRFLAHFDRVTFKGGG